MANPLFPHTMVETLGKRGFSVEIPLSDNHPARLAPKKTVHLLFDEIERCVFNRTSGWKSKATDHAYAEWDGMARLGNRSCILVPKPHWIRHTLRSPLKKPLKGPDIAARINRATHVALPDCAPGRGVTRQRFLIQRGVSLQIDCFHRTSC